MLVFEVLVMEEVFVLAGEGYDMMFHLLEEGWGPLKGKGFLYFIQNGYEVGGKGHHFG